ncbi:MAG: DUF539 domain-containing protein [Gammaproteobacteria bacterium]|nr:DUF539 domain-containing protein [Gammaproteobacteria bacterium]MDH4314162.1 DUF539 domain-containing protein [Gammaproteobacteria bacterium]MDH5212802.1 DUF539 domain-containing protein [Gammaproteobacteria bacterium]MDH5499965.1 DUF539 domain-containing protein [Gammaproteobacteria bacterium]
MTVIATFLLAFAILFVVIVGMAIGVLNGRRPISGSCGGLNGGRCDLCSGSCVEETER